MRPEITNDPCTCIGTNAVGLGLALRISRCLVISPHDLLLHEPRPE